MSPALRYYIEASERVGTSMRNLFDYGSSEYKEKTTDYRLEKLKSLIAEKYDLAKVIEGFSKYYIDEGKPHVVAAIPASLIFLVEDVNKKDPLNENMVNHLPSMRISAITNPESIDLNPLISIITNYVKQKAIGSK